MIECVICGNSFEQPKGRGGTRKKYCSEDCRQIGLKQVKQRYLEKQKANKTEKKKTTTKKVIRILLI